MISERPGGEKATGSLCPCRSKGGAGISYQIFIPDGSFLLDQMSSDTEYRGQLWQSGDHVVEVINRGNSNTSYNLIISVD